jgi:tRNA A-37 threonylcarbamoyl transferase component Bud32
MKGVQGLAKDTFRFPVDVVRHLVGLALLALAVALVLRFLLQLSEPTDVPLARTLRAMDPGLASAGQPLGVRWPPRGGLSAWPLLPAALVWGLRMLVTHQLDRVSRRLRLAGAGPERAAGAGAGRSLVRAPGETIGRFEVVRERGRGPRGTVYQARDPQSGRLVAVKALDAPARDVRAAVDEARRLQHPSIVRVQELAEGDGVPPLVVSDWVDATNLAERTAEGPLPRSTALLVGAQVAAALAHAHGAGVVHGNLVPTNVLLGPEGRARLTDFGLPRPGAAASTSGDVAALASLLSTLDPQPSAALREIVGRAKTGGGAADVAAALRALAAAPPG